MVKLIDGVHQGNKLGHPEPPPIKRIDLVGDKSIRFIGGASPII